MLKKRYIITAFLAFCLTATLLVGVTSSAEYDPWVDLDDSGEIDIFDALTLAGVYGTSGNPTKNVNVTNWPGVMNVNVTNWPSQGQSGTVRNETEKIVLFECEQAPVRVAYTWHPAEFTFAFNPKQTFGNVTDMQIEVILKPDIGFSQHKFDIKFNDVTTISSGSFETIQYELLSLGIHIEDPSVYQVIHSGINTLALTNPQYYDGSWHQWFIHLYRLIIIVEYEWFQ